MSNPEQLRTLFSKYLEDKISSGEMEELRFLLEGPGSENTISEQLRQLFDYQTSDSYDFPATDARIKTNVLSYIRNEQSSSVAYHRVHFLRTWWVAAGILVLLTSGLYLLFNRDPRPTSSVTQTTEKPIHNDIAPPAHTKAVLTLADGTRIVLDSAGKGSLAMQGNTNIIKLGEEQIAYTRNATGPEKDAGYNTLSNPRGSKMVTLTLADGTQVWLNAESSLRYPAAFTGHERRVQITGEAYFEVAKDPAKKFIVEGGGMRTEVLGTHFNINTYEDEKMIKVTLLEGRVKVVNRQSAIGNRQQDVREATTDGPVILKPGEQAILLKSSERLITSSNIDVKEIMAWKNGMFYYKGAQLQTIMQQVARAYDIEVVFEDAINEKFFAEVPRNTNVSTLFKMLEITKAVRFTIEGKKVTVRK